MRGMSTTETSLADGLYRRSCFFLRSTFVATASSACAVWTREPGSLSVSSYRDRSVQSRSTSRDLAPLRLPAHGCRRSSLSIYSPPPGHPGAASFPHQLGVRNAREIYNARAPLRRVESQERDLSPSGHAPLNRYPRELFLEFQHRLCQTFTSNQRPARSRGWSQVAHWEEPLLPGALSLLSGKDFSSMGLDHTLQGVLDRGCSLWGKRRRARILSRNVWPGPRSRSPGATAAPHLYRGPLRSSQGQPHPGREPLPARRRSPCREPRPHNQPHAAL